MICTLRDPISLRRPVTPIPTPTTKHLSVLLHNPNSFEVSHHTFQKSVHIHTYTRTRAQKDSNEPYQDRAHVLQCVAVCCSVLQCVAVCCSVLQCVAVCCRMSPIKIGSYTKIGTCSKKRGELQCAAVRCSMLRCAFQKTSGNSCINIHICIYTYPTKRLHCILLRRVKQKKKKNSISVPKSPISVGLFCKRGLLFSVGWQCKVTCCLPTARDYPILLPPWN